MTDLISLRKAWEIPVTKLRRDPWEPWSHIEIHLTEEGWIGPWVKVRSGHNVPDMEGVVDGAFEEKVIFTGFDLDEKVWEPWSPPDGASD